MYLSTYLGGILPGAFYSNYALAYRPIVCNTHGIAPKLADVSGYVGTLAVGKISGSSHSHDILKTLYPMVSGIDSYWVEDKVQINTIYDTEAIDLLVPPVVGAGDIGKFWWTGLAPGGGWAGNPNKIAELMSVGPPVWSYHTLPIDEAVFNKHDSKPYVNTGTPTWLVNRGFKWLIFTSRSDWISYPIGSSIVLMYDTDGTSERAVITDSDLEAGGDRIKVGWLDLEWVGHDFDIFLVRQRIKKIHFQFGDGGYGSTSEVYELTEGLDTEETPGPYLYSSSVKNLEIGDVLCFMDGFNGVWAKISGFESVLGQLIPVLSFRPLEIPNYMPIGTQFYKVPKYIYSKAGDIFFAGGVEREDGFISDYISDTNPYDIGDIEPEVVLSAEKMLVQVGETIRIWGIESSLFSFDQEAGVGLSKYYWRNGAAWIPTSVPYIDLLWLSAGTKVVELYVTNETGQPAVPPVTPISISIVVATLVVADNFSDIISIVDFTNGYTAEDISGGRETEIDENLTQDEKSYDSPIQTARVIRLSGLAKDQHAVHPIPAVEAWRATKGADFIALPDDLVTLKYIEEHKAILSMMLEGETTYLLMGAFNRDREWNDLSKRNWNATFTKVA